MELRFPTEGPDERAYEPAIGCLREAASEAARTAGEASDEKRRRLEVEIRALEEAARVLEALQRFGVRGALTLTRLPLPETRTAASELRVVEDHESDDPTRWREVRVEGRPLRPLPGALVVEWVGCEGAGD